MKSFNQLYFLDLHGKLREKNPNNGKDENVFNVEKSARKALSDELSSAIKLTINTTEFIPPGELVQVQSEKLRINKPIDFFVEECQRSEIF